MATAVQFDEQTHTYTENGVAYPSVTQIIEEVGLTDYDGVPRAVLERKAQIGTLAHQACELLDDDDLEWSTLPTIVEPYVRGYELFKQQSGFEPAMLERRMLAEVNGMKYGMTPDRVGLLNGVPHVLDLKCAATPQKSWGVQLAGYALGLPKPKLALQYARAVIHLLDDGHYKLIPYTEASDYHVFQWALGITWWKRNMGY